MQKNIYRIALQNELKKTVKVLDKIPEVRYAGDPILRKECKYVTKSDFSSGFVKRTVNKMKSIMLKYRKITGVGRGLAANQIGISKKIILIDPLFEGKFQPLINSKIVKSSDRKIVYPELCWSWGAVVTGDIVRSKEIEVQYLDIEGNKRHEKFKDIFAVLLQHEIDHLYGKLCTDSSSVQTLRFTDGLRYKPRPVKR